MRSPNIFLENDTIAALNILGEAEAGIYAAEVMLPDRLYVGNIPYATTEDELKSAFEKNNIQIRSIIIPKKNNSEANRGFAFMEPETKNDILLALDLDGILTLSRRRLNIHEYKQTLDPTADGGPADRSSPIFPLSNVVYVGNLNYSANDADIKELLSKFDISATKVTMLYDKNTGKPKGICFIELASKDEASRVIGALNNIEFMNRKLFVNPARPLNPE